MDRSVRICLLIFITGEPGIKWEIFYNRPCYIITIDMGIYVKSCYVQIFDHYCIQY